MIRQLTKITLIVVVIHLLFIPATFAQSVGVLVYPPVVELDFSNSPGNFISRVVQVENPTTKLTRVRAYTEDWNLNEYGGIITSKDLDEHSLANYLKFNPKEFDLAPGQKQMVRITAKLPQGIDGEFRSIIFFETVTPKKEILNPNPKRLSVNVKYKTSYGVAVYAYKGKISRSASLIGLEYEKHNQNNYLVATLKNSGNIHSVISGNLTVLSRDKMIEIDKAIPKYAILPDKVQKYRIQIPDSDLPSGNYTARLRLVYKDCEQKEHVIEAEKDFEFNKAHLTIKGVIKENEKQLNDNSLSTKNQSYKELIGKNEQVNQAILNSNDENGIIVDTQAKENNYDNEEIGLNSNQKIQDQLGIKILQTKEDKLSKTGRAKKVSFQKKLVKLFTLGIYKPENKSE